MIYVKRFSVLILALSLGATLSLYGCSEDSSSDLDGQEKNGVLFFGAGLGETYAPQGTIDYMDHIFPFFPYGFYAGSPYDGGDCYTLIHYANEGEAFTCKVDEGTPIDIFCNEYTNLANYPIHPLSDAVDDGSFATRCNDVFLLWSTPSKRMCPFRL